ncbi:MAG TPA: prepilin-type N-terminal cleavage/methylation domain-containing protein, partial [Pirellulales bacterium]
MKIAESTAKQAWPANVCTALTDYKSPTRAGFTLAELMIVILIICVVTIATIPLLQPAMDSRRIREAARIVSSQFAAAQNEAVASGHTVGVWLEKLHLGGPVAGPTTTSIATEGNSCMDMYLCENPQPYAGESANATCQVSFVSEALDPQGIRVNVNIYFPTGTFTPAGIVQLGDQIVFNYRGTSYMIDGPDSDGDGFLDQVDDITPVTAHAILQDHASSWPQSPAKSAPVSYQILRLPVKSVNTAVQLPNGSVIDLSFCGMGNPSTSSSDVGWFGTLVTPPPQSLSFNQDTHSLAVLFDSSGRLATLYVNGARYDVTAPLYFLIGKR